MEFDLIRALQDRLPATRHDVVVGIGDDAALVQPAHGSQLAACTDTLVEGVHFLPGTAAADLGWKALAVNLSDLAAMGATPCWALLALALPDADRAWMAEFADGFSALAQQHGVSLIGGDTTRGPLTITVTALGTVSPGQALRRSGARVGDGVYVSGTPGDAALALRLLQSGAAGPHHAPLLERLARPQPRVALGVALRGLASAAIDVSDGLLADLGHIASAGMVGIDVHAERVPASAGLVQEDLPETSRQALQLTGGDDYELAFCMPRQHETTLAERLQETSCTFTRIGDVVSGSAVRALDGQGGQISVAQPGWEHFR